MGIAPWEKAAISIRYACAGVKRAGGHATQGQALPAAAALFLRCR
jgi:hypothetical protein